MLNYYAVHNHALRSLTDIELKKAEIDPIWVDIIDPTPEEAKLISSIFNISISAHNEVKQIKLPSCYYQQKGEVFAKINVAVDDHRMRTIDIILTKNQIITTQCAELKQCQEYLNYILLNDPENLTPNSIFAYLLEARMNDIDANLNKIAHSLDNISQIVFYSNYHPEKNGFKIDLKKNIDDVGKDGHLISKNHESLVSIRRALNFVAKSNQIQSSAAELAKFNDLLDEVSLLEEHIAFLAGKMDFLLSILFGMIDIEQNMISKVFSIAALIFLPPTIIASVYGMNFDKIPLLHFEYGFEFAVLLIALSSSLPYLLCKLKRWI